MLIGNTTETQVMLHGLCFSACSYFRRVFCVFRVTAVSVFGDSGQQNTFSGVALAHESGKLELHYFTRSFTGSSSAEEGKLESFLTEAF